MSNSTGLTLDIEEENEIFIGNLKCTGDYTALGYLNCSRDENGSVVIEKVGPLICVAPQSYSQCDTGCIVVIVLAVILLLLLIPLLILLRVLFGKMSWSHIYIPSAVGKVTYKICWSDK